MAKLSAPLVITSGEPAGIGPDLCVQISSALAGQSVVVAGDKTLLQQRAAQLGINVHLQDYLPGSTAMSRVGAIPVIHIPLNAPCIAGELNAANSRYVLDVLQRAVAGCLSGEFSGMVTAPVHKGIINEAGIGFTGHTEYLADLTSTRQVVMMLVGGGMRVALATTHLALKDVCAAITSDLLEEVLLIIHRDLGTRFGIPSPRILVAGLNPHAGENGYLGREEIEVMIPVLDALRRSGVNVSQPLPADTLFTPDRLANCDCVLAIYHDQGLPVLKHASFGQGVNVTLGLPVIRTSVDHGTALDLAGTGRAHLGSLLEAIKLAADMAQNENEQHQ